MPKSALLTATALVGLVGFAPAALAQSAAGSAAAVPDGPGRNAAEPAPATGSPSAAADDQSPPAADVVVTGSLFRRTDTETPSPVSVISSTTLEQRGLTTVADAVQTIAAGNGGGVPQNFTNAFASGASGISLRGLTTNSTLTLFDNLRAASYPLADDGQRSFVDLNTIPSAIVDRVEVLRDGASSTYGADAIAGVVNVILKKEIRGVEGRVESGISERGDSDNQRVQLTAGYGDLADQGFNIYLSGEYQHVGAVYNRDRGFPFNTNNLLSISQGNGFVGRNGNFGYTPPTSSSSSGAVVAVVRPALLTTPGNDLTGVAVQGGQFQVLGSCASQGLATHTNSAGTYCEQDLIHDYNIIQPEQTRFGGTLHATANLGADTQAYIAATFYQSRVVIPIALGPSSIRSNGNPVETRGIALPAVLANGQLNPQDPFAASGLAALIYYRFGDIGPSILTDVGRTYRVAAGIDGKIGDSGFGYSAAATYMRTDLEQARSGFLYLPGLLNAINNGTYNFVNPSANTQTVRDSISPTLHSNANSELWQLQAVVTKDLFALAGGPLQLGVGGQLRYEAVYDPSPVPNRDFFTVNPFSAVGSRYVSAAFVELNAPVLATLEVDASGRYDHYSTGFSHFSPKIGAKFTPIPQLALRGTYSQGFRAPSIPEQSGAVIGFVQYTPAAAVQARYGNDAYITSSYGLGQNSTGNPDVKPETSRAFTGGAVLQPKSWLSLTVDYYNIRKRNLILPGAGGAGAIADAYLLTGVVPPGVTITPNQADPQNPTLRPTPLSVNFLYSNGNVLQTSGIDAQIQAKLKLGSAARLTTALEGTEILDYTVDDGSGNGPQQYVGTLASYATTSASGTPRWRANWQNTVEAGPYTLSATTYFVSGYKGYAADYAGLGCANAVETSARYSADLITTTTGTALQCTVRHWIDVDLTASVRVGGKFTFYVNAVNLLDAKAPFDPNTYGGNNYNPAWSSAGVIGRLFRAGATFKF